MIKPRRIELLAPAKDLACGIAAIDHGADAVYIGAPKFGARSAAVNSLNDIAELVNYAHLFGVRIYVTVNTILKEEELEEVEQMIWQLYRVGVDALIVQDMGITRLNLPPIPLHASTQMDTRTPERAKFLADAGFRQVVLARELTLNEIHAVHQATPVPLEVFIHGALCVSYSGQCYVSQACFSRSANRGACAQFCRLAFDLLDNDGEVIVKNKHLLSLKDLNQSGALEELLDAGLSSFKIEGRLKDVTYVKNITAYYRQKLDAIITRRAAYVRASSGQCTYSFTPHPEKSFNRGFTSYFLRGRGEEVHAFHSPKSMGEEMGRMKEKRGNFITVAGLKPFNNGDGACFIDEQGKLQGFRINKVDGNKLYPKEMPRIQPRATIYRNYDQEFEKLLARDSSERKIAVDMLLAENNFGFTLTMTDEDERSVSLTLERKKELARTPQVAQLKTQLGKLGNTPFQAQRINVQFSDNWFLPASVLAELRRQTVERLMDTRRTAYRNEVAKWEETTHPYTQTELSYLGNVSNSKAEAFYKAHGVEHIAPAFEQQPVADAMLMSCKHCIKFSMGWCAVHQKQQMPHREPLYLQSTDGKRFRLSFDCKHCQMNLYAV